MYGLTTFGSSPLARGTLVKKKRLRNQLRLIPARAGNIRRDSSTARQSSAHPRSRGEHDDWSGRVGLVLGSSPLARGTWQKLP